MSLSGSIAHLFLRTGIASIILWGLMVFYLEIPMEKIGMLLLLVFAVNFVAYISASLILARHRGY